MTKAMPFLLHYQGSKKMRYTWALGAYTCRERDIYICKCVNLQLILQISVAQLHPETDTTCTTPSRSRPRSRRSPWILARQYGFKHLEKAELHTSDLQSNDFPSISIKVLQYVAMVGSVRFWVVWGSGFQSQQLCQAHLQPAEGFHLMHHLFG